MNATEQMQSNSVFNSDCATARVTQEKERYGQKGSEWKQHQQQTKSIIQKYEKWPEDLDSVNLA